MSTLYSSKLKVRQKKKKVHMRLVTASREVMIITKQDKEPRPHHPRPQQLRCDFRKAVTNAIWDPER